MWCEAWVKRLYSLMEAFLATAALLLVTAVAGGGELRINVQSFPPGQALKPGVAVLLSVEGLEPGQTIWHRVAVEGDVVLKLDRYHLFAGTVSGPRTFIVQVAAPGADPFAIVTFNYGTGSDPPDPPVPPLPPADDLAVYTTDLVRGLAIIDEGGEVATLFLSAATRIDTGELRGSAAIVEAVSKPLAAKNSTKWQAFSTMLFQHLLNERRLISQVDWAAAYKSVAAGLRGEK